MKRNVDRDARRRCCFFFFFFDFPLLYVINAHCRRTCSSTSEIIAAAAQSHSFARAQSCQPRWLSPFNWNNCRFFEFLTFIYGRYQRDPSEKAKRARTRGIEMSLPEDTKSVLNLDIYASWRRSVIPFNRVRFVDLQWLPAVNFPTSKALSLWSKHWQMRSSKTFWGVKRLLSLE